MECRALDNQQQNTQTKTYLKDEDGELSWDQYASYEPSFRVARSLLFQQVYSTHEGQSSLQSTLD